MKAETQHLDFLISQYVDGALEGAGKKSVEQKMLTDPDARKLYAGHREVQDLLDDYGSRIPLINWGEFERQLDARLEAVTREKQRGSIFRRRLGHLAAAAALLIAASLGYGWHAFSHKPLPPVASVPPKVEIAQPQTPVAWFPESMAATKASQSAARVEEPGAATLAGGRVEGVAYAAPADQVALQALETNIQYGFGNLANNIRPQMTPARGSAVGSSGMMLPHDDGDMLQ